MRKPDFIAQPGDTLYDIDFTQETDVWIMDTNESAPSGSGLYVTDHGVSVAFRPHKEAQNGTTTDA